jgi:hypothetical protein
LPLPAAAEFGAVDEKVYREDQRGEREEDKAAMGFLMMPTYITREVSKVQRRVLNPLPCLIRFPSVFYAIYIQNAKFLKGKALLTPALCYGFCHAKSGFQTLCTKHKKRKSQKKPMFILFVSHCKP